MRSVFGNAEGVPWAPRRGPELEKCFAAELTISRVLVRSLWSIPVACDSASELRASIGALPGSVVGKVCSFLLPAELLHTEMKGLRP